MPNAPAGLFAAVFVALYVGHMVGDHLAQTDSQANRKAGTGRPAVIAMLGHISAYGTCQIVALVALEVVTYLPISSGGLLAGMAVSLGTHAVIDRRAPVRWLLERTGSTQLAKLAGGGLNGMYLADQALHIGCVFAASLTVVALS